MLDPETDSDIISNKILAGLSRENPRQENPESLEVLHLQKRHAVRYQEAFARGLTERDVVYDALLHHNDAT